MKRSGTTCAGICQRISHLFWISAVMFVLVSGCAMVKPTRHYEETTPIDSGLTKTLSSTVAVGPFDTQNSDGWGRYAAQRLTEYLIDQKAFQQVIYSEGKAPKTDYVITGTLDHLFYGGGDAPTTVFLTVRLINTADSQTLFYRTIKASSKMSAFHMTWLRRVDVPSPYIEDVLDGVLKRVALDISSRTRSPAVQAP